MLTVLTWNIWFGEFEYNQRMNYIISEVLNKMPDIICFQEVLPEFENIVNKHHELLLHYNISSFENVYSGYGILTLCKKNLYPQYEIINFPTSSMNRCLLVTTIDLHGHKFAVGNVHLESLNNHNERENQLKLANELLEKYPSSIIVGDFNFDSDRNFGTQSYPLENDSVEKYLPEYLDLWEYMNPHVPKQDGYTYNSDINSLIDPNKHETMRYDRMMMKWTKDNYWMCPKSLSLVGNRPVDNLQYFYRGREFNGLFPSDHFGLFLQIDLLSCNSPSASDTWDMTIYYRFDILLLMISAILLTMLCFTKKCHALRKFL
jgi:endonuclease/exonuclease/phosphatase family metal-dependent hydrolase